jgi:hypothetical protein
VLNSQNEGASENLLLAWRYNESIQTQEDLKGKQQDGAHLINDFKNRTCDYQFDLSHTMTPMISGHNVPISKDKYFNVIDEQFTSLDSLYESICSQYEERLESADDQAFFRFFIPNFLSFDQYDEDADYQSGYSSKNIVKFLKDLKHLVSTMNCVFTITIDRTSLESNAILNYMIKFSDLVLELKSFSDSPDSFIDYQGFIKLLKQPCTNGLVGQNNKEDTNIFVFKSDKKSFKVETIHMDIEADQPEPSAEEGEKGKNEPTML